MANVRVAPDGVSGSSAFLEGFGDTPRPLRTCLVTLLKDTVVDPDADAEP